ncbi:cytochrome c oxidase assembly protein COX11 [Corynascus novoguineensis]|uniref:Cytochrome c oxidase assembly protein COX11 n=1 Tax=Corynascus novoguineensis TaxID=1126955 RepID=A0AAN7HRQ2_9PEZI|nr:cytochrome c oxidase assembly protein COX11 [Corynascus novoguineensis]
MLNRANPYPRKKVAVVGSGCAGIAALWALNRSPHDVYIFEASGRLGGHTHTVEFTKGKYKTLVDTGFIVMNTETYPNFLNFLKRIGVKTEPTDMSFSVSRDQGWFEWAGSSLSAIFCQRGNLLSPSMWRMLFDVVRFNNFALDLLKADHPIEETIGEYLDRQGYSNAFRDNYLIPLTAASWSTSPDKCALDFPAVTLVRFLWNHHLLSTVAARPSWLTISTGSKTYIDKVLKGFPSNHLRLNTTVTAVTNETDGRVRLHMEGGKSELFDHVILATHGDQAYSIIRSSATEEERSILQNFRTTENEAVLHSDPSLMPKSLAAWSSWNYLATSPWPRGEGYTDRVCVTYNMNTLQHIPREAFGDVLVTLNPVHEPNPKTVQGRYSYRHPLYTPGVIRAQQQLSKIQNTRGISYAGAWTGYGFHEDGFSSGLRVAVEHLGASIPFEFRDSTCGRGEKPSLTFVDYILRLVIALMQVFVIDILDGLVHVASRSTTRRLASKQQQQHGGQPGGAAPGMGEMSEVYRRRNRSTAYYTISIILGTVAFSYGSVPMYKMICQTTGWGGQPVRAHGTATSDGSPEDLAARLEPVTDARRIRVTFSSSVSDVLPWKFTPQQREVRVLPGETALAFYTATNTSDRDIVGVATYSVTPAQTAPYFSKIQCFCFEEQRLAAGETVDMPVFFYLDPDLLKDLNMRNVHTVTLNYTFFKARYDENGRFQGAPGF